MTPVRGAGLPFVIVWVYVDDETGQVVFERREASSFMGKDCLLPTTVSAPRCASPLG